MEEKKTTPAKVEKKPINIYEKIEKIRVALQDANIKKTGKNGYTGFNYFTLDDFLPTLNKLMLENKLFSNFSLGTETATLTFIDIENPNDCVLFSSPIAEAQIKGAAPIQALGGVHTYMKRYLYLNAFEISESDVLDALVGSDKLENTGSYKPKHDEKLLAEAFELNIELEKVATYFKKSVEQLTDDDLKKAIAQKKKALGGTKNA